MGKSNAFGILTIVEMRLVQIWLFNKHASTHLSTKNLAFSHLTRFASKTLVISGLKFIVMVVKLMERNASLRTEGVTR